MGNSLSLRGLSPCCRNNGGDNEFIDMNFKTTLDKYENGIVKIIVVNKKGDNLHLFCDYGTLKYYNELNNLNSGLADKTFYFLNNEIIKSSNSGNGMYRL